MKNGPILYRLANLLASLLVRPCVCFQLFFVICSSDFSYFINSRQQTIIFFWFLVSRLPVMVPRDWWSRIFQIKCLGSKKRCWVFRDPVIKYKNKSELPFILILIEFQGGSIFPISLTVHEILVKTFCCV